MKKIVVLLTTCLLLAATLVGVASAQAEAQAVKDYPDLDFSMGSNKYGTLHMVDVMEQLLGEELSEQEAAIIRNHFNGQNVLYYKRPSVVEPQVSYDGDNAEMTVVLMEDYSYDPDSDNEICWIPARLKVGDLTAEFKPATDIGNDYYRATVQGVAWATNVLVTVEYTASVEISADTLNDFSNFAYDTAIAMTEEYAIFGTAYEQYQLKLDEYNENQAEWTRYQTEYDAYKDYQDKAALYRDYLLYQDYLVVKKAYDEEYAVYAANRAEWDTYNDHKTKYEAYVQYAEQYPELLKKYQSENELVQNRLALLALMEVTDPATGMSFIDTMMDDRVGQGIAEKQGELSAIDGGAVSLIVNATPKVQEFLSNYRSKSTDQEKYEYYKQEYSTFTRYLGQLYSGISRLYGNGTIYTKLQQDYPEYVSMLLSMLGSLYVYNAAFSDSMTLDLNYEVDVHGHKTVRNLVASSLRPATDNNKAKPTEEWPEAPVDPETYEVKTAPVAPSETVAEPAKPPLPAFGVITSPDELAEEMEEPETMEEPIKPTTTVEHPGTPPTLPWDESYQALYEAYKQGLVKERAPFGAAQTVTLTASANHSVSFNQDEHYFLVHFYNSDADRTYLGFDAVRQGESGAYPDYLPAPTKKPVGPDAFAFTGWVYENGEPADLSTITEDIEVYAVYRTIPRKCLVTWNVGDAVIEELVSYGSVPAFNGSTEKAPSAEFVYTFSGWDKELTEVLDDVTYTAQYTTTANRHKVSFVMGDGSVIEKEYAYGKNLGEAVPLQKPVKASDAQYTYTFTAWVDDQGNRYTKAEEFPILTGPVVYTAEFEAVLNSYTVTWIVDGATNSETYEYGSMPIYKGSEGEIPVIPSTKQHEYVFKGWDKAVGAVTQDVTYVAQFETVARKYTVQFIIGEKTISQSVEYGELPVFEGAPQRDNDVQYVYTFTGWDREFETVTSDTKYEALFDAKLQKYPVTFVVGEEKVVVEFEYGKKPSYPNGTPSIPDDDRHYYKFTGWDQTPVAVDGSEAIYTACFETVLLAPAANGEAGVLSGQANGNFELHISGSAVDLSAVFAKLGEEGAQNLQVYFGNAVLEFPKAQIDAFYNMSGAISEVVMEKVQHGEYHAYKIELLDAEGAHVQFLMTELTVKLPYSGAYSADVYHVEDDGTLKKLDSKYENGYLVFSTMDFSTFVIKDKFSITGNAPENGTLTLVGEAYAGDTITFTPDPDEGYHVDSVIVEANGQQIEVKAENGVYSFVMPEGNVQVTTAFKVVEGGTTVEVIVGVVTALLIVSIGIVILSVVKKRKNVRM